MKNKNGNFFLKGRPSLRLHNCSIETRKTPTSLSGREADTAFFFLALDKRQAALAICLFVGALWLLRLRLHRAVSDSHVTRCGPVPDNRPFDLTTNSST